jgi:hypothetical protein
MGVDPYHSKEKVSLSTKETNGRQILFFKLEMII